MIRKSTASSLRRSLLTLVLSGALGALILGVTGLATCFLSANAIESALEAKDLTADVLPPPLYLVELRLTLALIADGTISAEQGAREIERLRNDYRKRAGYWHGKQLGGIEKHLLGEQHQSAEQFIAEAEKVLVLLQSGKKTAQPSASEAHQAYKRHRLSVDRTVALSTRHADEALALVADYRRSLWRITAAILLAVFGLLAWLGYRTLQSVFRSTGGEPALVKEIANSIAGGNLAVKIPVAAGDQTSVMAAMNAMRDALTVAVRSIHGTSTILSSESEQLAKGSQDLSLRTIQQAEGLQRSSAALEEFSASIRQTVAATRYAEQTTRQADAMATQATGMVRLVVDNMDKIHESSERIAEITRLIENLAFQTNILALNAAVEAARAGQTGHGFAVVATEIRGLAHRASVAAKEIHELTSGCTLAVRKGVDLVAETGATMETFVAEMARISSLSAEIHQATEQQVIGVEIVSKTLGELDSVSHLNSDLATVSTDGANALRNQAVALVSSISTFRTE